MQSMRKVCASLRNTSTRVTESNSTVGQGARSASNPDRERGETETQNSPKRPLYSVRPSPDSQLFTYPSRIGSASSSHASVDQTLLGSEQDRRWNKEKSEKLTRFKNDKTAIVDHPAFSYLHHARHVPAAIAIIRRGPDGDQIILRREHVLVPLLHQLMRARDERQRVDVIELQAQIIPGIR